MARKNALPLITDFNNIPEEALVPVEEQPYPIPDHWKWVRLGHISELISGRDEPISSCNEERVGIPYVMGASNFEGEKLVIERWIADPKVVSSAGSLLITVKGTIGKIHIQNEPALNLSRQVMAIVPNELLSVNFLERLVSTALVSIQNQSQGLIPGISRSILLSLPIPLPPLSEQEQIVDFISENLEEVDASIQKVEQFLAGFDNHKETLIQAGVSGHLTTDWREKNGIDRENWKKATLKELGAWGGGGTPRKSVPEFWENGSIPWISPKDVKSRIISDTQDHVTSEAIEKSAAVLYEGPAICIVVRSGILRRELPLSVVHGKFSVNQDMKVLHHIDLDLVNPEFIYNALSSVRNLIRVKCAKSGTTVESIDYQKLLGFEIVLPPLAEQKEIVRILDSKLEELERARFLASEALEQLASLRASVVSAALAGRLT